jgi:F-type H+-transporting ATPase subunit a
MIFSPLEQFAIIQLLPFPVLGGLTNSMLFGTLGLSFWALVNYQSTGSSSSVIPSRWATAVGSIYSLLIAMIHQTLGTAVSHTSNFFVYIFTLFGVILTLNLTGLVPYSFTVTSHLIVTLVLSLSLWVGKGNIASSRHGIKAVNLVYPAGVPLALLFPLILIETLGFVITIISLSVRLFANMMAGHILLKVLGGFAWTMAMSGGFLFLAHFGPLVVLYLMMGLESGIAFVQAYVFCLLACIYLADAVEGGH